MTLRSSLIAKLSDHAEAYKRTRSTARPTDRLISTRSEASERALIIANHYNEHIQSKESSITRKERLLNSLSRRIERRADWEAKLEPVKADLLSRTLKIEPKLASLDTLVKSMEPSEHTLHITQDYNRLNEEYEHCVERAAKLKEEMSAVKTEIAKSTFYTGGADTTRELESISDKIVSLPRRRQIRQNASGRPMMSDATEKERIYYHRYMLLTCRNGLLDPNSTHNPYVRERFFLTARQMYWEECPIEEKARISRCHKIMSKSEW